jgi:DNA-binding Xre family transcriptional regulator
MGIRTCITDVARTRGTTAAEVARRLGWYRSNLSAMDAGTRTPSLRALVRVARHLDCGPGDLLEVQWGAAGAVFRRAALNDRLSERDRGTPDGLDKGWVHTALLTWQRHTRSLKRLR